MAIAVAVTILFALLAAVSAVMATGSNSQAAIGVQMAFAYVGSTFLPSIFGALAGVDGYGLLPYFAIGICVLMTVLFGIQKKIVETKVKTN